MKKTVKNYKIKAYKKLKYKFYKKNKNKIIIILKSCKIIKL